MKKLVLPIFLLLSLIVKSQTLSIDSSLEMTFEENLVNTFSENGLKRYDYADGIATVYSFDNISFKQINQSYLDNYSSDLLLMSVAEQNKITFSQIIDIDQILELKIIIEQVYKFRKSKNFNYSFGQMIKRVINPDGSITMTKNTEIEGNFSNGELLLNFYKLGTTIMDTEYGFIRNLSLVTELGKPSLFGIKLINFDQIKSLRKFLKKF